MSLKMSRDTVPQQNSSIQNSNGVKRILIFSLAYFPNPIGGAETSIKDISDRIDEDDIEFHLITNRYNSELPKLEKVGRVLVHRIGITTKNPAVSDYGKLPLDLNKPLFQFLAALKALSLHRRYKYDAIWAMMAHSAGVPAAIFKLFHPNIPYILTLQEGDPIEHIERVMRPLWPLFKRSFTSADVVQVISKYLKDWAISRGVKEEDIELIFDGANPRDLVPHHSKEEIEKLRKELGKKEGDIFLVNTARLEHSKAADITIRALPMLPPNVKLMLVGGGSEEKMLKDLSKELNVEHRVIFTGMVDRSVVSMYRLASDIFVGASRTEGLGHAFLSAMASRLPVITTQEGGIVEFLYDEERNPGVPTTGWAVDKDNPEQIAKAVKDIIGNPEKTKKVTDNAHKMVNEKFNWDIIARDMREKVFGRVL